MNRKISYAFRDDGVYAIENGQVVAHSDSLETLVVPEVKTASTAKVATHVVTPSGLKGKIMGQVTPGLWGNEVTVRFENGHIARLQVADVQLTSDDGSRTTTASVGSTGATRASKMEDLREILAQTAEGDELSLRSRLADLKDIREIATELASRPRIAAAEREQLDEIIAQTHYEASEVKDALEYLADAEPYAPPTPILSRVFEQEHVGRGNGDWLASVHDDMIREANETDYDQLLNEGADVFIADLDQNILADQGTTAQLATTYIESKVAAAHPEVREKYTELWLERVEKARRAAYVSVRKTVAKQASDDSAQYDSLPDDCLFS